MVWPVGPQLSGAAPCFIPHLKQGHNNELFLWEGGRGCWDIRDAGAAGPAWTRVPALGIQPHCPRSAPRAGPRRGPAADRPYVMGALVGACPVPGGLEGGSRQPLLVGSAQSGVFCRAQVQS